MRVALLTEGGYPYARGESALWCDRLLRGLGGHGGHEFEVYALSRSARQEEAGRYALPDNVLRVRTAPLWGQGPAVDGRSRGTFAGYGRRDRRRFQEHFTALVEAVCAAEAADSAGGAGLVGEADLAGVLGSAGARGSAGVTGSAPVSGVAGLASAADVAGVAAGGEVAAAAEAVVAAARGERAAGGGAGGTAGVDVGSGVDAVAGPVGATGVAAAGSVGAAGVVGAAASDAGRVAGAGGAAGGGDGVASGAVGAAGPAWGAEGSVGGRAAVLADRFAAGLYGLAELAAERGGLASALRSELAVRILESACRAPGALRAAHAAQVADLLAVTERLERALRPLSLDWYGAHGGDSGLSAADLCHAVGGGPAALPGLLAKRAFGVPLLITEYGVRLREHYLASAAGAVAPGAPGAPVRALLASFQGRLAREAYAQAQLITPGNAHAKRWQERCGARRERLRTVYPGMDAAPFAAVGERAGDLPPRGGHRREGAPTLVWAGRVAPAKDLITLLHAFALVREAVPEARLRIIETGGGQEPGGAAGAEAAGLAEPGSAEEAERADYAAHCRSLAERLFPCDPTGGGADSRAGSGSGDGHRPVGSGAGADAGPVDSCSGSGSVHAGVPHQPAVTFEELGGPGPATPADAYAAGGVFVLSSAVEGFPVPLVEAMFCGRATVSTDAGAVCEIVGGTGLVVPPRNPKAMADACVALLADPARSARLGAAGRSRALELFTVEQNTEKFRGLYLELMSHAPAARSGRTASDGADDGAARPFDRPAESHVPGRWAGTARRVAAAVPGRRAVSGAGAAGDAEQPAGPGPSWARQSGRADGEGRLAGAERTGDVGRANHIGLASDAGRTGDVGHAHPVGRTSGAERTGDVGRANPVGLASDAERTGEAGPASHVGRTAGTGPLPGGERAPERGGVGAPGAGELTAPVGVGAEAREGEKP